MPDLSGLLKDIETALTPKMAKHDLAKWHQDHGWYECQRSCALCAALASLARLRDTLQNEVLPLDDYEAANLREGLLTLRNLGGDTGDWLGQILFKIPPTERPPNVPLKEQLARVRAAALLSGSEEK